MSNYFNLLPDFEYVSRLPDAKISDYITVKNLFKRGALEPDILENLALHTKYEIKGDDRPDNVAYEYYGSSELDWLVLTCNNIINIQNEWPMLQNDFDSFIEFLRENVNDKQWHISYNGLAFDSQVTQYIIENHSQWEDYSADQIARTIFRYAQRCIHKANNKEWSDYPLWKLSIGQIDIFKMHHWDNPAKRSSLKWIQYSMDSVSYTHLTLPTKA